MVLEFYNKIYLLILRLTMVLRCNMMTLFIIKCEMEVRRFHKRKIQI